MSRSERSSWDLRENIARRLGKKFPDAPRDEIASTVDGLVEKAVALGIVNDLRWAKMKIRSILSSKGRRFAVSKLASLGTPKDIVQAAFDELENDGELKDESESVRLAWERKFSRLPADQKERQRQTGFLLRRGFSFSEVKNLYKALEEEREEAL